MGKLAAESLNIEVAEEEVVDKDDEYWEWVFPDEVGEDEYQHGLDLSC